MATSSYELSHDHEVVQLFITESRSLLSHVKRTNIATEASFRLVHILKRIKAESVPSLYK